MNHCAVLDIGKTNKKCFVFDEGYHIVLERTAQLPETTDEDGEPCEDLDLLNAWVFQTVLDVLSETRFNVRGLNVATYGASFVHLDANSQALTPLYNYLKPFPDDLRKRFFEAYGDEATMALETASPNLGNLNSGSQLYWLKHRKPMVFKQIKWSLHLPQYVAWLIQSVISKELPQTITQIDITSIGCHTMLWDFRKNGYHEWVKSEGIVEKFPVVAPSSMNEGVLPLLEHRSGVHVGGGVHDSSAALIPYLASFTKPFVLISTGTWCISLNPFNQEPLTTAELAEDCLCYLTFEGKPVKAARYFGGKEHHLKVMELAATFGVAEDFYTDIQLHGASDIDIAYLGFMRQLVEKQAASTRLALGNSSVQRIFVDGGFSKNEIYMTLLAQAFPEMEVCAAEIAQSTALGAAMAIHLSWNPNKLPENLISLQKYEP